MADETSGIGEGLGRVGEHEAPEDGARNARALTALRIALAGVVLLAGLAVAAPTRRAGAPAADTACSASVAAAPEEVGVIVLPPGHPPIPGARAHGQIIVTLPPGHPPIDERRLGAPIPAEPLAPLFQPPATVDL